MAAAKALADEAVEVILIDQHNFHTFQPLLYEVATADLDPADVAYPIRATRVVLIDGLDHVLSTFNASAQRYAEDTLRSRSVELALGQSIDYHGN